MSTTQQPNHGAALERRAPTNGGAVALADDPFRLGAVLAKSGYFRDAADEAKAVVKVLAGQELGLGPIASMTGIHIIEGKPSLGANLLAALVKNHPRYDYRVKEMSAERCVLAFYEQAQHLGDSEFSMDDARKAQVAGKQNWQKFPRNMLFARAVSNGVGWYCPDLASGAPVYTPEELGAEVEGADATPVVVDAPPVTASEAPAVTAAPRQEQEPLASPKQQRMLNAIAGDQGLTDRQRKAIIRWVSGAKSSRAIPAQQIDEVKGALEDAEGTLSAIFDEAAEGDVLAKTLAEWIGTAEETPADDGAAQPTLEQNGSDPDGS